MSVLGPVASLRGVMASLTLILKSRFPAALRTILREAGAMWAQDWALLGASGKQTPWQEADAFI